MPKRGMESVTGHAGGSHAFSTKCVARLSSIGFNSFAIKMVEHF